MNKNKIKHPFQVPDNFFDDFKKEMIEKLENLKQDDSRTVKFALRFTKYAAIIVLSFFLGRASMSVLNNDVKSDNLIEAYSIDEVMLQMTDEDITDFIIEDGTIDL